MDRKSLAIGASVTVGAIILVAVLGTSDLSSYQSTVLKYDINTDCQLFTTFLNGKLTSDMDTSKINPELNSLLSELLAMDHIEDYDKIQSQNPHCEDEFRKLN